MWYYEKHSVNIEWVYVRARTCVCVCVCEREREREQWRNLVYSISPKYFLHFELSIYQLIGTQVSHHWLKNQCSPYPCFFAICIFLFLFSFLFLQVKLWLSYGLDGCSKIVRLGVHTAWLNLQIHIASIKGKISGY